MKKFHSENRMKKFQFTVELHEFENRLYDKAYQDEKLVIKLKTPNKHKDQRVKVIRELLLGEYYGSAEIHLNASKEIIRG